MNLMVIFTTFLLYGLFVAAFNGETSTENAFPSFQEPSVDFYPIPDSCGGFADCIEYVGRIITNFVLGVVYVVLLLVEIIRVLVALIVLVVTSAFTGVDGAPTWFNNSVVGMFGVSTILIIYKSIRSGSTDAE